MNGPSMSDNREIDIVREAQLIIDKYAFTLNGISAQRRKTGKKNSPDKTLWFIAGVTTSFAFFLALFLKIY